MQYEIPKIPAVVIYKVLFPQANILAAFVNSNSRHFSDDSAGLPTYSNHNITKFTTSILVVVVAAIVFVVVVVVTSHKF